MPIPLTKCVQLALGFAAQLLFHQVLGRSPSDEEVRVVQQPGDVRLEVVADVDWRTKGTLLKAAFPNARLLLLNGPNLNLLGKREPSVYGSQSFDDYLETLKAQFPDLQIDHYQSNVEGELSADRTLFDLIAATFPAGTVYVPAASGVVEKLSQWAAELGVDVHGVASASEAGSGACPAEALRLVGERKGMVRRPL